MGTPCIGGFSEGRGAREFFGIDRNRKPLDRRLLLGAEDIVLIQGRGDIEPLHRNLDGITAVHEISPHDLVHGYAEHCGDVAAGERIRGECGLIVSGGIENDGFLTITDSTISGNSVEEYGVGGGIQNGGTLTLTNSTVTGNRVDYMGSGGGIYTGGPLTVTNSIVADNTLNDIPYYSLVENDCVGPSCPTNEER